MPNLKSIEQSNRNYRGGGAESALPSQYQSAKCLACLGLMDFVSFEFLGNMTLSVNLNIVCHSKEVFLGPYISHPF